MKDISESEILQALQDAMDDGTGNADGVTPTEAFEMLRDAGHIMGVNDVRRLFKRLVQSGQAQIVTVQRQRWDGVVHRPRGIVFLGNGK